MNLQHWRWLSLKSTGFLPRVVMACAACALTCAWGRPAAAQYAWNAGDGTWNTIDANWTGSGATWTNGAGSDAVFSNTATPTTITLGEAITAGSVSLGDGGNNANYTLTGSSLSAASLAIQGDGNNNLSNNPTATLNDVSLSLSGDLGVGRAYLNISGTTTLTADRIGGGGMTGIASADWGNVTISGSADVTAANGIVGGTAAWGLNLNGGTLTTSSIQYGPATFSGSTNLNFNGTLVKANQANSDFITVSGTLDPAAPNLQAGGALLDTNGFDVGISLPLGGSGGLTKSGTGTLTLGSDSSSYAGVTTIAGGTLNATTFANYGSNSSLGNRAADSGGEDMGLLFRGGTLQYTGATAQSTDRAIRLSTNGGGGTIDASGSDPSATLTFSAPSSPNFFENPGPRTLTLTGSNTGENTFASAISQAGGATSVVKSGAGKWVLSGNSTYTGGTTVSGGTLQLASTTALGGGGLVILNGTTLALRSDTDATFAGGDGMAGLGNASVTFDVNTLTPGNTGKTLSFSTAGFNTFETTINVTGGNDYTLALGSVVDGLNGGLILNADSANLSLGAIGSTRAVAGLSFTGAADITVSGGIAANGNVSKTGAGTLTLSGTSSYATTTIFGGGIVNAATFADYGSDSSLGNRAADSGGEDMGLLFRGGTLQYTGATAQSTDRAIRLSTDGGGGTIDASGSDPSATLTFSAPSSPNFFENPGPRTLTLTGSNTGENTFASAISQAGGATSVVKSGAGTWVLSGASSYTGGTTINGGLLAVNGSLANTAVSVTSGSTLGGSGSIAGTVTVLGTLAPGNSPGTLTISNGLTLDGGSFLSFEIDAADPSSSVLNDLITGVTDLTLGGTLNLSGNGDFTALTEGTSWRLIDFSGGLIDNILTIGTAPTLASGLSFSVDTSTANQVNLVIVPEPGSLGLAVLGLAVTSLLAARRWR